MKGRVPSPQNATKIMSKAVSLIPFLFTQHRGYKLYSFEKESCELGNIHLSKYRNVNLLDLLITAIPQLLSFATVHACHHIIWPSRRQVQVGSHVSALEACIESGSQTGSLGCCRAPLAGDLVDYRPYSHR